MPNDHLSFRVKLRKQEVDQNFQWYRQQRRIIFLFATLIAILVLIDIAIAARLIALSTPYF